MRFTIMVLASSLLVDVPSGEQVVRRPRPWDAIGTLLQRVYAVRRPLPDPLARLLPRIDADDTTPRRINDRR